ncbi:Cof-type HAD-IIB family hydrolase [Aquimarina sp. ERC-38]|uniref:Cof-type HAD-IIB family hydrolase n=1 Tax=Aquimarina sp. ERC-38 TaxID=2949996 RepID=UPI00224666FB|nr:Cof-type HAD-IIB family hydrolase [Aquimarina sp. ERC-38]UZO79920.1 Cof-type HAD-IIB family hydrolase [Aquimarina sp. ERC-38]
MTTPTLPKILFTDIDGTLLNTERELSEATITEIQRIKDRIKIILISSRMPSAMKHLQEKLNISELPLICYNGGLILIDNKTVFSKTISNSITKELFAFNKTTPFHLSLYQNDEWYVPELDFWAKREINNTKVQPTVLSNDQVLEIWGKEQKEAHKIMCMGETEAIDKAYCFLTENFKDQLHCYRSKDTYIEIAEKSISKKTAIAYLADYYKVDLKEVIAFGDNYNDIEMLKAAGIGIAVANAKPEVLAIADYVTSTGKEDGVATYIRKFLK